jgi:hypothetical protein
MLLPGSKGTPVIHTGAPRCVYEKRDEGDFLSIYYVEHRQERGKQPEEIIRRLVLPLHDAMKLRQEIYNTFADAGVSFL